MNRSIYFNFIEDKLSSLAKRIELRGSLNILDYHIYAEYFYKDFFNLIFGWKLKNINNIQKNAAGIDLIDRINKIIVQVSATATKQKIESALSKDLTIYKGYTFKFISISKDASDLRTKKFANPHTIIFEPSQDILDNQSLLSVILGKRIDQQKEIYEFIKRELISEPDIEKMESNLATIINILSKEDWSQRALDFETVPFDVEAKISYNKLEKIKPIIDDFKIFYSRIDKIYYDCDAQGANKSLSILNSIRNDYLILSSEESPVNCFWLITTKVFRIILESENYTPIPEEELAMCVQILVVDAFIRCKIFKNPSGYTNVNS